FSIVHLNRKKQRRAGQAFRIFWPEITLVEIKGGLAVQFEQNISGRTRHLPPWTEHVPSAGAAVSDLDRLAIEADGDHNVAPRRAIASDKRFCEVGAIAGESSCQRNAGTDRGDHTIDEFTAVDVQAVGQDEYTGQIVLAQGPANGLAAAPRLRGIRNILSDQPQFGGMKADRRCHDSFITHVVVVDLPAGAAT